MANDKPTVIVATPEQLAELIDAAVERAMAKSRPAAEQWVDKRGAAAYGLAPRLFLALCASGEVPASKVGKKYVARASDLAAYLERQRLQVEPAEAAQADADLDPVDQALRLGRLRVLGRR